LVIQEINSSSRGKDELAVIDEATLDKDYGWVFFYTSRKFLETGDFNDAIPGTGPVVVERTDGSVHFLGSNLDTEELIERYEAGRKS
jgi:hypothetical protein